MRQHQWRGSSRAFLSPSPITNLRSSSCLQRMTIGWSAACAMAQFCVVRQDVKWPSWRRPRTCCGSPSQHGQGCCKALCHRDSILPLQFSDWWQPQPTWVRLNCKITIPRYLQGEAKRQCRWVRSRLPKPHADGVLSKRMALASPSLLPQTTDKSGKCTMTTVMKNRGSSAC